MATVLKIKRSSTANAPATLGQGEVAYSWGSGATNGQRLYIGTGTETGGNAANIEIVGGKYYTDRLKFGGTDFTNSMLIGHSTTGTLDAAINNVGIGALALDAITSGDTNTALGYAALGGVTSGGVNTAIGGSAGSNLTTGHYNTAVVTMALLTATTAGFNTAIGYQSLRTATGHSNTALGRDSGYAVTTGNYNILVGRQGAVNLTTGDANVIIGNVDADSATADHQLKIAGYDGTTTVNWLKSDSTGKLVATAGDVITGKIEGTNFTGSLLIGHSTSGTLSTATYNTGVGIAALDALTTGDHNTCVGYAAGSAITTGYRNTGIGHGALGQNIAGTHNTAIGSLAGTTLGAISGGTANTLLGYYTGGVITTGNRNIMIGNNAGDNLTTGSGNVIIGVGVDTAAVDSARTLQIVGNDGSTTTTWIVGDGSGNLTFSGKLQSVTDPTSAQDAATKAYVDTQLTAEDLDVTTDSGTIAIDLDSETLSVTGGTGIDTSATGNAVTVGIDSTVMTGKTEGTNFENSLLVGHTTTGTLDEAIQNTGVGIEALDALTSGDNNTAVGFQAGTSITTGFQNTAIGDVALDAVTTGGFNTALGRGALGTLSTGSTNTAVGRYALKLTTGTGNTALGKDAGENIAAGGYNICIGEDAGDNITSGSGNVIIGKVDAGSATGSRQLVIAGNDGTTTTTWIQGDSSGKIGIGVVPTTPFDVQNGTSFSKFRTTNNSIAIQTEAGNVAGVSLGAEGGAGHAAISFRGQQILVGLNGSSGLAFGRGVNWSHVPADNDHIHIVGSVGINVEDPTEALDVSGSAKVSGTVTTTVNSITGVAIPGKFGGTNFPSSLLVGSVTTGTLNNADGNIGVGGNALRSITQGDNNIGIGLSALDDLTTGGGNIGIGRYAIGDVSTGEYNVGMGMYVLREVTGDYNVAFGSNSGNSITSGDYNIVLGQQAGQNITTGSGNIIIGKVDADSATGSRQLKIAGYDGSTTTTWITGDSSGNLTFNGKLHNVTDPTAAQDVATKSYVDAVATGLDVKDSVALATTAALAASTYANGAGTITANANGALTVDSVAVAVDDRILVKNQAAALQNGIYKVTATGSAGAVFVLTRTPDADTASEITGGAFTFVEKGTINADNGYVFTHDGTPTLGSTAITVAQFSGAGQITAGAALSKTNNTLDVEVDDSSIQVTSDALNVKALGVTNAMLAGSIANAKLTNSVITVTDGTNSTATALGGTVTFTESEAIDITESSGTVTIAAEVATSANKGVASFNTGNFTVASGDVTVTTIDGGSY